MGGILAVILVGACSSSLQYRTPDADTDSGSPAGGDGGAIDAPADVPPDGTACEDLQRAYYDAVLLLQECTIGASGQCGVQVRASFFCNCTTSVNGGADTLAAIADRYQAAGCRDLCNGTCAQPRALTCQPDATSATGGRCQPEGLLQLTGANDGESFSVAIGDEVDIVLQNIGPSGYGNDIGLSSDSATIIEVTIPAGLVNPGGPMHLYRLRAVSAGQVVVQIPYLSVTGGPVPSPYAVTLDIH